MQLFIEMIHTVHSSEIKATSCYAIKLMKPVNAMEESVVTIKIPIILRTKGNPWKNL